MSARAASRVRLLPVVIAAGGGLLALKVIGLATQGGYLLIDHPKREFARGITDTRRNPVWAEEITGSVPPKKDEAADKGAGKAGKNDKDDKAGKAGKDDKPAEVPAQPLPPAPPSAAEREILEKLAERRKQLDERMKDLDMREALIKTAEKALDDKLVDLKASEAKAEAAQQSQGQSAGAPMRSLVVMYEAMKPRDAARVFEKMDPRLLIQLAGAMNPKKLSEVLSQMTPDAAEKLTAGLIRASGGGAPAVPVSAPPVQPPPPAAAPAGPEELQRLPLAKTPKS